MDKSNAQKTFGTLVGKKILIVDDEKMNQLVISNMIKRWGAESDVAESGSEALQKITKENYDIILMDLLMPGLDGYQTSEKIRNELLNKTPILALTGTSSIASEEKITKAGINDFAAKPFRIEELHAKIFNLILGEKNIAGYEKSEIKGIISLNYLKETASGNPKLVKEIINIFLSQTPGFLSKLDESIKLKNWAEVKIVAHKMKPTVSYVGISSIESIIKNIEDFSEQNINLNEIPVLYSELKNKCETAFIELKKELDKIS